MDTNELNGVNQQTSNVQSDAVSQQTANVQGGEGYQQAPNYQGNVGYQQAPNYQGNAGYQQAPNYQGNAGYQQSPDYQGNAGYQQAPDYQGNAGYQQSPNYQNNAGYQQAPNYQGNAGYQQSPNYQGNAGYQQAPNYQNNAGYQQPQNNMNYPNGQGMGYSANQAPKKAPNIFKQFAFSFVPPKYRELARAKVGSMIFLIILLVFLLTGFDFLTLAAGYVLSGGVSEMLDLFPDFSVEDGEFSIDQDFYVEEDDTIIYMTEDVSYFDYDDVMDYRDDGFDSVMLVGRENICIYSDREFQELYFYELGDIYFDKETIENTFVPMIWLILLIWYAVWFVLRVLWYFLCAAVYLLVGMLLALIFGKKISAGHIFKAAVFAKIPLLVIASLWNVLPIDLSFPGILRILATLVLFGFGVWFLPQQEEQYRRY